MRDKIARDVLTHLFLENPRLPRLDDGHETLHIKGRRDVVRRRVATMMRAIILNLDQVVPELPEPVIINDLRTDADSSRENWRHASLFARVAR